MNPAPLLLTALLALARVEGAAAQDSIPPYETFTMASTVLGETRRINVYTPPGYQPAGRANYPVLYVLNGGVQEGFPHVAASMDAGIREREVRPMLVVGIENTDRHRDMTPAEVEEGRRLPRRVGDPSLEAVDRPIAPRVDGAAVFRSFIAGELMPELHRRYRLSRESAIMGDSLAGLFVVETFMLQGDLFGTYIALSPNLWWNREALVRTADAQRWAGRLRLSGNPSTAMFLFSRDEENVGPVVERLARVLRANGAKVNYRRYRPRADLAHATLYRAVAQQVLREVFPPVFSIVAITAPPEQIVRDLGKEVTPPHDGTRVSREPVGPFTVMREEYTLPDSVPRGLHTPTRWTKVHLSFDTPDGRVNVTLTDNGAGLSATARSPGCGSEAFYLQYARDEDERHLFDAMFAALRALVEPCAVGMEDPAGYLRLLERAETDFPAAVRLMKARVFEAFGARMERCTPPEPTHVLVSPHGDDRCGPS